MPKQCDLTGKHVQFGNRVSHSNRKTRRRFEPNLRMVVLESVALRRSFRLQVAVSTLRTVEFKGGLDQFLTRAKAAHLSEYGCKLRRAVKKRVPFQAEATQESAASSDAQ